MNKGIILLIRDFEAGWLPLLQEAGVQTVGLHAQQSQCRSKEFTRKVRALRKELDAFERADIRVEYELHAVGDLLDRDLFETRPELFRANENGGRTADLNCCPSSAEALERVAEGAYRLAKELRQRSHRYHLWPDDDYAAGARCLCPRCAGSSVAEQSAALARAVLDGIRRYDPCAVLSYLAYGDTQAPHNTQGLFLEFAPFRRDHARALSEGEVNAEVTRSAARLAAAFGPARSQVTEYWLDKAYFAGFERGAGDPGRIAGDLACYRALGFGTVTSFTELPEPGYLRSHAQAAGRAISAYFRQFEGERK